MSKYIIANNTNAKQNKFLKKATLQIVATLTLLIFIQIYLENLQVHQSGDQILAEPSHKTSKLDHFPNSPYSMEAGGIFKCPLSRFGNPRGMS